MRYSTAAWCCLDVLLIAIRRPARCNLYSNMEVSENIGRMCFLIVISRMTWDTLHYLHSKIRAFMPCSRCFMLNPLTKSLGTPLMMHGSLLFKGTNSLFRFGQTYFLSLKPVYTCYSACVHSQEKFRLIHLELSLLSEPNLPEVLWCRSMWGDPLCMDPLLEPSM